MRFKELDDKQCFMFVNDEINHYIKSGYNSYFCHEDSSHHYMSGSDLTELENREVFKVKVIYEVSR